MGLNIKNERVHALAREAAERAGLSQTSAIEQALVRYLEELGGPSDRHHRREAASAIARDFEARLSATDRDLLTTDALYDERGLPA